MAILITGGSGFVGLNLLEQLLGDGKTVVNYSLAPPPPRAAAAFARLPGRLHTVIGDVQDRAAVEAVFAEGNVEQVIHAAVITAGTEREKRDAGTIVAVNVLGTVNVLEAARRREVSRILYVSSGAVYGANGFHDPVLDEQRTPPLPVTLYAITKYAAERVSLRFKELWGLPLICARLGGVFGRWEYDTGVRDTLSPPMLLARLADQGKPALLPHEGKRDWIYAPDIATALVKLLGLPSPRHDVYNVGPGREWTLTDWCTLLQRRYPGFSCRVASNQEEVTVAFPRSSLRAPLAVERLREDTGFQARFGLEEAFADYTAWLEEHPF